MRSYSARPVRTGRYLVALVILTLLYLALMLPAAAAVTATLALLGSAGQGLSMAYLPPLLGLVASGTYPLIALFAIVVSWFRYGQSRYVHAVRVALLPLVNMALFGLAVLLVQLLEG